MSDTWTQKSLSATAALRMASAAVEAATTMGLSASIVVSDQAGTPKVTVRMDGASPMTVQVASDKAFTAACAQMPTAMWSSVFAGDVFAAHKFASSIYRFCSLAGGIPANVEGVVVGAIGVSGGDDDQDVAIAMAGIAALTSL